jgi:hypothetical protein
MKVRNKLIIGLGSILGIFTLAFVLLTIDINHVKNISKHTATESVPMSVIAEDTKFQSCQIQQFLTDGSLTQNPEALTEAENSYKKFMENISKFEKMFKDENNLTALEK